MGDMRGAASCTAAESEEASTGLLEAAIHELAQPLTALSFILEFALLRPEAEAWREALLAAQTECRRAVLSLKTLRATAFPETSVHGRDLYPGELF